MRRPERIGRQKKAEQKRWTNKEDKDSQPDKWVKKRK